MYYAIKVVGVKPESLIRDEIILTPTKLEDIIPCFEVDKEVNRQFKNAKKHVGSFYSPINRVPKLFRKKQFALANVVLIKSVNKDSDLVYDVKEVNIVECPS